MMKLPKYSFLLLLVFGLFVELDAQHREQLCLSQKASFLYQPYPELIERPLKIDLKAWKIKAKDTLEVNSDFFNTTSSKIIGVFSKDSILLSHHRLQRIPNAIDYGKDFYTSQSLFSGELTNIKQDLVIDYQPIIIPKDANYLFLGNSVLDFNPSSDSICFNLSVTSSNWRFDVKTIAKVKVAKCRTKIFLWDDSNEDGDIVTLYLNGKKIINRHEVVNKRHKIQLDLQSGRNEFWIYAENMGKLGDNTAVLQIKGKPYRRIIPVNSKTGTAKNIVIICEE